MCVCFVTLVSFMLGGLYYLLLQGSCLNPCAKVWLTHWGRVTHICVVELATIGSDNGSSPVRCQAIIWTNAGILLIGHLGTNFSEILIGIQTFSFKKLHLKTPSAKWRLFCLGLNELKYMCGNKSSWSYEWLALKDIIQQCLHYTRVWIFFSDMFFFMQMSRKSILRGPWMHS